MIDPQNPQLLDFPGRITIELTNCCNLRCTMCPRRLMKARQGFMDPALFKKLIDEIASYPGTALIPFFRGESMLHPEFISLLRYAHGKGVRPIQLATNATRLTPEIAQALIDLPIDFVSFSLDSIDPETYAAIRVGGKLNQVLSNINNFCSYRREKHSRLPAVQVSVVKTGANDGEIGQFVQHWQKLVDRVRIFEQHSADGYFGSLGKLASRYHFERRLPCHKVFTEISIYWDGQVALCCHDWDRRLSIGNVARSTIAEIWHNQRYAQIRETHTTKLDELEPLCRNCDQWKAYYLPQGQGTIGDLYINEFAPLETNQPTQISGAVPFQD